MNGAARIRAAFAVAADEKRSALVTYVVAGHPDRAGSVDAVCAAATSGADVVELGLPFSDPLADGTVIRQATTRALAAGISVRGVLEIVADVRARGCDVPLLLMGYVNPVLAYGLGEFCRDAAAAGVDGLILPDVPLEEAAPLREAAAEHGLGLTFLVTPVTDPARRRGLVDASTAFCYAVARTGTTGARDELDPGTIELLHHLRDESGDTPVAVGFGVSTPAHVRELAPYADGVVVGSALVDALERGADFPQLITDLRAATHVAHVHVDAVSAQ